LPDKAPTWPPSEMQKHNSARLERLEELEDFTESCKKQLDDIFSALGWSRYEPAFSFHFEVEMVTCPFDPNHRLPKTSLKKHKASCRFKKMGYSTDELVKISVMFVHVLLCDGVNVPPLSGQYSGEPVDVPQNHQRALCDLTVADRLALYDHVSGFLSNQREDALTTGNEDLYVDLVKKMQKGKTQKEPKTHLELMAEMRDYKRRRQSYRAKNVHITKKSYTEVIREVINVHSEELSRQWKDEEKEMLASAHRYEHGAGIRAGLCCIVEI
uniref:Small nuclear ribonucleoprotein 48 (U11/U12) n=1 Tax=Neogobius melanostomus TaxID=47308 RepID=A0A8C6WL70_9GOBI